MVRLILLILCFIPLVVNAQQVSVASMKETTDFIPGADQRCDYNGDLCALVKIQVVDEVTEVEGNVMGDIIFKGVEKWVYVAKGSKNLKIHLKNYLPIIVKFKDYKIDALQGNRIYELVINTQNMAQEKPKLDIIEMKDLSYILCKIVSVKKGYISFKQDEVDGIVKVPIKEVSRIKYVSGAQKKF